MPATAFALPDGDGKEMAQSVCGSCHGTRVIERSSGYSREDWSALIGTMIDLSASQSVEAEILDYLETTFPPSGNRAAKAVDGPIAIQIEQWLVPTLGQRSRDPVEDADGNIWWVGQWRDILGRLDPATGEMEEFRLPAGAKPHSVNIGPNGMAWYTGNRNATIGRFDPATETITEFAMPDPEARDPHTAEFDESGTLWFTLQRSNMIGRLNPQTGDVQLVESPRANSRPYGIKIAQDGTIWVACNGANCLLKVHPETMEVTEISLPDEGTKVRRLDIDPDGNIWWVNSGLGRLGRFEPQTGEITEWPSPSGPGSHPYAIAVFDGAIWYNESGVRPDMLVRFAPGAESFQSWPIPSGNFYGGILRHMRTSLDGTALLVHQSGTNQIARITVTEDGIAP
ncbi:virginiamycin B lyase family protein [Erythrobacter sp. Alg231-14]|uniref:virginiamycin B lyase family protein n=1 Tax=Erythrobacter sp. Alg231-14 TaxID=1922225 RepID=UPI000D54B7C4